MKTGFVNLYDNKAFLEYFSRNVKFSFWHLPAADDTDEPWITRGKVGSRMLENLASSPVETQLTVNEINSQCTKVTALIRNPVERFISAYWQFFNKQYRNVPQYSHLFYQKTPRDEFFKLDSEKDIEEHYNNFRKFVNRQLEEKSIFDSYCMPVVNDDESYHFLNYISGLFGITIPLRLIHLYHMPTEAARTVGLFPDKYEIFKKAFRNSSEYEKMMVYLNNEIFAYNILKEHAYKPQANEFDHFIKKLIKQRAAERKRSE